MLEKLLQDPRSKTVPAEWRQPISDWMIGLRAAGLSSATIATRSDHLRRPSRALGGAPWSVTDAELIGWAGTQSWSSEARRSVYASLRSFWGWAVEAGHVKSVPTNRLPRVKAAPPRPRPAPDPVISQAKRGSSEKVILILRLAAELGMRRSEIAQVHSQDVFEDLDGWSLVVHGKGDKERTVPMGHDLAHSVIKACLAGGGFAFPGKVDGHWSARHVGKLATRALPGDWTLHTLRHRFATTVNDSTGDLLVVQELLGHASVATTQRYVATSKGKLRAAVATAA